MKTDALNPDDDRVIWRYMDLARFVSTLLTGRLWFAKMATLRDDPYEGFSKALGFQAPVGDKGPKWITRETGEGKRTIISVDFDLEQLVSAVHVGPRAHGLVVDAVSSLMSKFEFDKPVIASPLLSSPPKNRVAVKA